MLKSGRCTVNWQALTCIIPSIQQEVLLTTHDKGFSSFLRKRYGHIHATGGLPMIHRGSPSLALAASGLALVALSMSLSPAAIASEQRAQAPATFPSVQMEGFKLQRKDFRFGEFTGWLKRDGTWHIEGPVRHNGLLCGTYEVGVRFGVGERECTNVQWISEVAYVTSTEQCNNAERPHSGTEIDESLAGQFDAINCAERVIRCSGTCK